MLTEGQNFGITEFRTCWKQYTPLKLRFAGVINSPLIRKILWVPHTCEPSRIIREPPGTAARLPHSWEWDRTSRMWKYKKKIFFFFPDHHFCTYIWKSWSLVAGRQLTAKLVWIYKPLTNWHLTLKHHTEKVIKSFSDDIQWEFIISYLFL